MSIHITKYTRRMLAFAQAYIAEAVAKAVKEGGEIDGTAIGRTAAAKARAEYFSTSIKPAPPIEAIASSPAEQVGNGSSADRSIVDLGILP